MIGLSLLVGVCGTGYWAVYRVEKQAALFGDDTLRKITYSALLNAFQAEGYARNLLVLESDDPQQAIVSRQEGRAYREKTDLLLVQYEQTITPDQVATRAAYDQFIATRDAYRAVQLQIRNLLDQNQLPVARALIEAALAPAYQRYALAGDRLLAQDVLMGQQHARDIESVSGKAKILTLAICVVVFIGGFLTPVIYRIINPKRTIVAY